MRMINRPVFWKVERVNYPPPKSAELKISKNWTLLETARKEKKEKEGEKWGGGGEFAKEINGTMGKYRANWETNERGKRVGIAIPRNI